MKLTDHIVEHIFENLGMLSNKANSIFAKPLEIQSKVVFENNGEDTQYSVFACESMINQKKMIIVACILADDPKEMVAIVSLEDCPVYGCSLLIENGAPKDAVLVVQIKDSMWVPTSVFLQASFLAGMEQLKDLGSPFTACQKPNPTFQLLLSFIKYLDQNAGQNN